jgi:glycosyltransferase involved in cell wall biosynthesis
MIYQSPPIIPPIPMAGKPRPFWSVMIPAYNPNQDYLEQTLHSVLAQDPGPDRMQIEVVDDCSPAVDVAALVREIVGERVNVSQTLRNLGLAGCWNTCIERARGQWVHILHQDDLVLPGFYQRLESGIRSQASVGAAFCRNARMGTNGHWFELGNLLSERAGVLENWLEQIALVQMIETPAILVKRSVYEHLGGFRTDLSFVLDWEMWIRIAAHYPFYYEPAILCVYRVHGISATSRLARGAEDITDMRNGIVIANSHLPAKNALDWKQKALEEAALFGIRRARGFVTDRETAAACRQVRESLKCAHSLRVLRQIASLVVLYMKRSLRPTK